MKSRVAGWLLLCAVTCTLMATPAMAQYAGGQHFGDYDEHHVWRDAQWWHGNNPEWMYSHHPEWVVEPPTSPGLVLGAVLGIVSALELGRSLRRHLSRLLVVASVPSRLDVRE